MALQLVVIFGLLYSADGMPRFQGPDIGPDTCNQDRVILGNWFIAHGLPSLLQEPIPDLVEYVEEDPYENPNNPPENPDLIEGFCAMKWSEDIDPTTGLQKYHLENFKTEEEVQLAGYNITHQGKCAACSNLQDLGVYISQNLTDPTRLCGILGVFDADKQRECLKNLGFSDMCASIWEYNIKNTRNKCWQPCIWAFITNAPNNNPDGSLNKCLQCDEDLSGPNFKYFSGRTRRNSGIPSAIYRPPETIYNMTHCYWYGDLI